MSVATVYIGDTLLVVNLTFTDLFLVLRLVLHIEGITFIALEKRVRFLVKTGKFTLVFERLLNGIIFLGKYEFVVPSRDLQSHGSLQTLPKSISIG